LKRLALLLLCCSVTYNVAAETLYVGDNQRVGVRPEPGTASAPLAIITTGDRVEVLEAGGEYSRVRTADGKEGWVRNTYLSKALPASRLIEDVRKDYKQAQQEILALQKELALRNQQNQDLEYKNKLLNDETFKLHQQLSTLRPDSSRIWIFLIIATVSLCGLAFTLGILWNKQQVAKKLGGHTL
jgi:SH3 domain protein